MNAPLKSPPALTKCLTQDCQYFVTGVDLHYCTRCTTAQEEYFGEAAPQDITPKPVGMSARYPKYYKSVENLTEVDVYLVHHLFDLQDPSGALQHASKKILLPGVRTGNKTRYTDIKEARDTLTRWLEIQEAVKTAF